ncbi:hypothetical protein [Microcoleus sp. B9-D4]|uniref:hypothetical protein n=1 Tax=Microcoleus sp. B9-D4 TaxID=2818711 RepID=UPI002FD1FA5E
MIANKTQNYISPEEYLAAEEISPTKHESPHSLGKLIEWKQQKRWLIATFFFDLPMPKI